jgi:hypothetical protein
MSTPMKGSLIMPPEYVDLLDAEAERRHMRVGLLIKEEVGRDPRYVADLDQAQRTGGDVGLVAVRYMTEAAARLVQRLKANAALLDSIDPLDIQ